MAPRICDVAPRDGLQSEAVALTPETRAELCGRLLATGLPEVEAVSFVRDDRVPQLARAERVIALLDDDERERCSGLALNERGVRRALASGLRSVHVAVMATEEFSVRNVGTTVERSLAAAERMIAAAHAAGASASATVSVAFGCPFEGAVDAGRVEALAARLAAAGADELMLADTIGVAEPLAVARLCERLAPLGRPFGVHLHDTGGNGYANALAAVGAGASILESSAGGIGGCPFAPGSEGNIATEQLVRLLEGEGMATGVDVDALLATVAWLDEQLCQKNCMHVCNSVGSPS
jgi:isopropylmalate/homocitrate/citramalate synthase